jgi:hypothetical protein
MNIQEILGKEMSKYNATIIKGPVHKKGKKPKKKVDKIPNYVVRIGYEFEGKFRKVFMFRKNTIKTSRQIAVLKMAMLYKNKNQYSLVVAYISKVSNGEKLKLRLRYLRGGNISSRKY